MKPYAAMLDPSQRHLAMQVYLDEHETNGVQFLTDMIEKYCSAATPDNADSASGQPADDGEPVEPAWKKAKQEMLAKHGSVRHLTIASCSSIAAFPPCQQTMF